ncbi:MAG: hypothetical protein IT307_18065 [Chloroflexi bacterium]|nr:hypothetical protein [Chloroflexota bacterium]
MADKVPHGLDPDVLKRTSTVEVDTFNIEKMKHQANVKSFSFYSDEPPWMNGDDRHPYPLDYLTAAIGM